GKPASARGRAACTSTWPSSRSSRAASARCRPSRGARQEERTRGTARSATVPCASLIALDGPQRWELVDYVMSLRVPAAPPPPPSDASEAGRAVAGKYGCRGCHVLDDGAGGDVGP